MKNISWDKTLVWSVIGGGMLYFFAFLYILFFWQQRSPEIFDGEVIARIGKHEFAAEIADTEEERARGLSGRSFLRHDGGMLFLFQDPSRETFWMKEMEFPIDIIWIRDGKVVGFHENVPAPLSETPLSELPLYISPEPVDKVFEISAGRVAALEIKTGDKFLLR